MRHELPGAHRIDLLGEARYHAFLGRASLVGDELRALPARSAVVVDEIQRLPQPLNEVHRFIEEHRFRFVLCGSSARKLKQRGTNLLAGRALRRALHPFVPAELGTTFDLDTALATGTLPVICRAPSPREAPIAYVQLYLREEIQAEALVRNLPGFARFLPIAALSHGLPLNVASLARDAEVSRTTVAGYVDIIEDTLLALRLPAHEGRLRVRERRHPKLYWVDAGIVRALERQLGPVAAEEQGPRFEGWIGNLRRIHDDYRELFEAWSYWAPLDAARTEVDFLLRRGREWLAVEAKSRSRIGPDQLRGLRAIADLRGLRRRILVYRGERRLLTADGIEVWPVRHFLDALAADRLWP